jgi:flavorubredoxin
MAKVLIVYHSMSGNTEAAAKAVEKGARQVEGVEVVLKKAMDATVEDLLECDAIAIGTPDYFSYMAGALKDFFDRTFYPTHGKVNDKPYFAFVTHGGGGRALDSVERIANSFNFKKAFEPVLVQGRPDEKAEAKLMEAGKKLAEIAKGG